MMNRIFKRAVSLLCAGALSLSLAACHLPGGNKVKELDTTTFGIDVARYQGTIDWAQVAENTDFAIIRVGYRSQGEGLIKEDVNGRYNLQEASRARIPIGAYFFSTATSVEEAQEEAQWVADLLAPYPITYPVVYDCEGFRQESSRQYGMSNEERTDVALAFLKAVEKRGYEGMFYAAKNEIETFWDLPRISKHYKIWVAQYPVVPYPETPASSYEGAHQMWQYTMEGKLDGISQPVDMNVAYFGYDGIREPKDRKTVPEEAYPNVEALLTFTETNDQVTAKVETNLRNAPSTDSDSEIIYTLQNGEYLQRIATSANGWSKLHYNGAVVYARSDYLTGGNDAIDPSDDDGIQTKFSPRQEDVTAKDVVNLRSIPSVEREDSEILFQLNHGDVAVCVGVSDNGWSKLEYKGQTCYAVSSYLTSATEEMIAATAPTEAPDIGMSFQRVDEDVRANRKVNLRTRPNTQDPDSKVITTLAPGESIHRTGVNKELDWSRVVYQNQILYCVSPYLSKD